VRTEILIRALHRPLGSIALSELEALRERLEGGRAEHAERLAAIEQRKSELFADGIGRADQRDQLARARQIRALNTEGAQVMALLRIIHKQRLLLDRLIWLRESLEAAERLRATMPAVILIDWLGLLDATQSIPDEETQLDRLNRGLQSTDIRFPDSQQSAPGFEGRAGSTGFVVRVLDGGSIELASGQRVRYIGVDSPQLHNALGRVDTGAWEARDANHRLVAHKRVRLVSDRLDADSDGTLWRYVFVDDLLINAELLRQGVVLHVSRYPNTRLEADLLVAEREAKRHRQGLWKTGRVS